MDHPADLGRSAHKPQVGSHCDGYSFSLRQPTCKVNQQLREGRWAGRLSNAEPGLLPVAAVRQAGRGLQRPAWERQWLQDRQCASGRSRHPYEKEEGVALDAYVTSVQRAFVQAEKLRQ